MLEIRLLRLLRFRLLMHWTVCSSTHVHYFGHTGLASGTRVHRPCDLNFWHPKSAGLPESAGELAPE